MCLVNFTPVKSSIGLLMLTECCFAQNFESTYPLHNHYHRYIYTMNCDLGPSANVLQS